VFTWDLRDLIAAFVETLKDHERERFQLAQVLWQISRVGGGKGGSKPPKAPKILTEE